jgi:predicted 3-demethylubiquinone-9 3-methyltransferase (glyoxalase superfamily)
MTAAQVAPFLMFEGRAEEAMTLYTSLFEDAGILEVTRYGPGEPGAENSVLLAVFHLNGQRIMCIDSPAKHEFTFTPSMSLFVNCGSEEEVDRLFAALSQGGAVMMPLGVYPFSRKFGWLADKFGVSWQLNLPHA